MGDLAAIENRLRSVFAPESMIITDDTAAHAGHQGQARGRGHYMLTIVSRCFQGHAPLARHRLVYDALGEMMGVEIHSLRIEALTPEEL
jgi:BolA family transcriptional regulator, general stress-responsive regulator